MAQKWLILDMRTEEFVGKYEGVRIDPNGICLEFCNWKGIGLEFVRHYKAVKTDEDWVPLMLKEGQPDA